VRVLTVDTLFLRRFYVLFFIELATRRVRLAGITTNPDGGWVTQQARNLLMQLDDEGVRPRFLVRDRDSKFIRDFDEVFRSEGIRVIRAPVRAPKARAHAERWVGSVRRECLDRLLILGRRHLQHVLVAYIRAFQRTSAAPSTRAAAAAQRRATTRRGDRPRLPAPPRPARRADSRIPARGVARIERACPSARVSRALDSSPELRSRVAIGTPVRPDNITHSKPAHRSEAASREPNYRHLHAATSVADVLVRAT
jgi:hypothetical protein